MLTTPWTVVLAAGNGRRLAGVTGGIPKQFWSPSGGPTLLEETLRRMAAFAPPARTVTVIDRSQARFIEHLDCSGPAGWVVVQPLDRGTAAGVLLGLTEIDQPDALVAVTPSDHGVADTRVFHRGLRRAATEVRAGRADVVVFGVRPTSPAPDFGWITPHASPGESGSVLPRISGFTEKPHPELAASLFARGAIWNTMVLVAKLSSLLALFQLHLPELAGAFAYARQIPAGPRGEWLAGRYPRLRSADFSRDLLGRSGNLHVYIWPSSMGWTDLGTPERLLAWLDRGRRDVPSHGCGDEAAALVTVESR
jgi:mannose-1-phosphate guanylyltransferase